MKKVIPFVILTFSFQVVFAQKEEWTKQFEITKEATELDNSFYESPDASKLPPILSKYEEALKLIAQVEEKSSDYKASATFRKAWIYTSISYLYEELKDFHNQEKFASKAFNEWPYFGAISQYNVEKHIKFNESNPLDIHYTKMLYLATWAAHENKNYSRVYELEKLYEPVKKNISTSNEWLIVYDIARTYQKDTKSSEQRAEKWVDALERWKVLSSETKERNKGPFDYMVKNTSNMITNDNNVKLRGAKALYENEKYAEANKLYSSYAKSVSSPSLDAGWDYSESAMKEPDKTDARNSVNIIEQHTSGFSEYDWERLQKVYEFIGDNAKVQEIKNKIAEARRKAEEERRLQAQREEEERKRREKEQRKRDARGNFSVAVATNPIMYIWADYPVSLDIRIGRVSNEFRVNITNTRPGKGDNYHFNQWRSEGVTDDLRYHYSGYEFSYTLKILGSKGFSSTKSKRKQYVGGYVGFQPRYSMYDFNPEFINFTDATTAISESHLITASAQRYEFSLIGGFLGDNLGSFFHVDYYIGVGIGYRTLDISSSSDPNFDINKYRFDQTTDQRYEPKRWDKLYVPIRLGLRFGINLL